MIEIKIKLSGIGQSVYVFRDGKLVNDGWKVGVNVDDAHDRLLDVIDKALREPWPMSK